MKLQASESWVIENLNSNQILEQRGGDVSLQKSPCCTFNIALSLMGYDEKILINEVLPEWFYDERYHSTIENHKAPHDPSTWMKHSCVWYSKELAFRIGKEKFKKYIQLIHYGNEEISLDWNRSWLSASLKISPLEQITFLKKLLKNELPFSLHAHEMTKNILFVEELLNGWKLFGKTGTGLQENNLEFGWFVGWVTKEESTILVTILVQDEKKENFPAGFRAKEKIKGILFGKDILR